MARVVGNPSATFAVIVSLAAVCLLLAAPRVAATPVVTVAPQKAIPDSTCFPLHAASGGMSTNWQPFAAFFYKNLPAFELAPGDLLKFDAGNGDGIADKRLAIAMSPTTVNGGNIPAAPFTEVVANTVPAAGAPGDSVRGNFDIGFTVGGTFSFAGGGLVIRFSNPAGGLAADAACDGGLFATDVGDPSGLFVGRAFSDPDGTAPWSNFSGTFTAGFQVDRPPRCRGKPVTIMGTDGDDGQFGDLRGTSGPDVISTGAGDDIVLGGGGNDVICGGRGRDELAGGRGKDLIAGEAGKDFLFGDQGKDKLLGGKGRDYLKGGKGKDRLKGGPGKDRTVK